MKKKIIGILLMMALTATMFVGCGSDASSSAGEATTEAATEAATEEVAEAGNVTEEVTFDLTSDYEPNTDYDKYTLREYTWEDVGETAVILVCANEDETEFELHFTFFGDEQLSKVTYDGGTYEVTEDKTGFVTKESPIICQEAVADGKWATIEK